MPIGKLKALNVTREKRPGMYSDGGGLYLQVTSAGAKSWIFRYRLNGHISSKGKALSRETGLGSFIVVSLDDARQFAADARRLLHQGIDPIDARREAKQTHLLEKAKALKFKDAATAYIAAQRAGWKNEKHAAQWTATLETYAYPVIGGLSVQAIDTGLVLKVLEPIWSEKSETASRVRGRIEAVLDWAKVRGYRVGENPARWRGHLDKLLPARSKVQKVEHHAALPYAELPNFLVALRAQAGIGARALEFTILTAARTGETIGADWDEINARDKLWIIPDVRMKAGKKHRVPLTKRALEILDGMKSEHDGKFVFPGAKAGRSLSNLAMLMLLRRMKRPDLTVHGFRSTFRDWAAERTSFPSEVVEMALAHAVGDKVEAAYLRADMFDKRRRLMDAWAEFCGKVQATGTVVALRK